MVSGEDFLSSTIALVTQPNLPPQIFAVSRTAQPHARCSVKPSQQVTGFLYKTMENLYIGHLDVCEFTLQEYICSQNGLRVDGQGKVKAVGESIFSAPLHMEKMGCRIQYSGYSCTSPGDVFYHKLPNFAQSKETALVHGVQMQLSFDFSAPRGSTGTERGSCHHSLLLLSQQMSERAEAGNSARPAATGG